MGKGEFLGEFETIVLLAVIRVGNHAHGAAVHREIYDTTGRDVSIPTVHVTLKRLVQKKYLNCTTKSEPSGGRARRVFEITDDGVRQLERTRGLIDNIWEGVRLAMPRGEA